MCVYYDYDFSTVIEPLWLSHTQVTASSTYTNSNTTVVYYFITCPRAAKRRDMRGVFLRMKSGHWRQRSRMDP